MAQIIRFSDALAMLDGETHGNCEIAGHSKLDGDGSSRSATSNVASTASNTCPFIPSMGILTTQKGAG